MWCQAKGKLRKERCRSTFLCARKAPAGARGGAQGEERRQGNTNCCARLLSSEHGPKAQKVKCRHTLHSAQRAEGASGIATPQSRLHQLPSYAACTPGMGVERAWDTIVRGDSVAAPRSARWWCLRDTSAGGYPRRQEGSASGIATPQSRLHQLPSYAACTPGMGRGSVSVKCSEPRSWGLRSCPGLSGLGVPLASRAQAVGNRSALWISRGAGLAPLHIARVSRWLADADEGGRTECGNDKGVWLVRSWCGQSRDGGPHVRDATAEGRVPLLQVGYSVQNRETAMRRPSAEVWVENGRGRYPKIIPGYSLPSGSDRRGGRRDIMVPRLIRDGDERELVPERGSALDLRSTPEMVGKRWTRRISCSAAPGYLAGISQASLRDNPGQDEVGYEHSRSIVLVVTDVTAQRAWRWHKLSWVHAREMQPEPDPKQKRRTACEPKGETCFQSLSEKSRRRIGRIRQLVSHPSLGVPRIKRVHRSLGGSIKVVPASWRVKRMEQGEDGVQDNGPPWFFHADKSWLEYTYQKPW
ncbi:hypothetical protein B0H19DRAFT_1085519 [Mycena capillaripes]|nr:hypothetical protein B0H19DRAFT_1085519 [Mycena capillaripes]